MNSNTPLVSVIIPTYNRREFVTEAVASVRAQSYDNWELIVVDDGSSDGTEKLFTKAGDRRVRYVYKVNGGVSSARNRGFALTTGPYVLFLDSDDVLLPNSLRDHVEYLESHPRYGLSYSDGYRTGSNGAFEHTFSSLRTLMPHDTDLDNIVNGCFLFTVGAVMIRRSSLLLLDGPFDERMIGAEDWDLFIRLAAIGCRFGALNALTCRYRIHPGNKSSPYSPLAEKRKQARIYSRFKVMKSDWFNAISPAAQYKFFYEVLIDHLSGDSLRQEEMIASDAFSSLSDHVQARLLYYVAIDNLFYANAPDLARHRMLAAIRKRPSHLKSWFGLIVHLFSARLLRYAIRMRRSYNSQGAHSPTSIPFVR